MPNLSRKILEIVGTKEAYLFRVIELLFLSANPLSLPVKRRRHLAIAIFFHLYH